LGSNLSGHLRLEFLDAPGIAVLIDFLHDVVDDRRAYFLDGLAGEGIEALAGAWLVGPALAGGGLSDFGCRLGQMEGEVFREKSRHISGAKKENKDKATIRGGSRIIL
jgi:hypothetical protein